MKTCMPNPLLVKATIAAVFTSCATVAAQTAEGTFELAFATNEDVVQLVVGDASSSELHVSTGDPGQVVVQGTIRAYSDRRKVQEWVSELEANPPVVQSGGVLRIGELPCVFVVTSTRSIGSSFHRRPTFTPKQRASGSKDWVGTFLFTPARSWRPELAAM